MTVLHHIDFEVPGFGEFPEAPTPRDGYRATVLADAPIGYWRLNEPAGAVADDASGLANHGQYHGSIARAVPGALDFDSDPAAAFDGATSYIDSQINSATLGDSFTMSCWFKVDPATTWPEGSLMQRLATVYRSNASTRVAFGLNGRYLAIGWRDVTGYDELLGPTQLDADTWYHAALTYDGQTLKLYRNGRLECEQATALVPATAGTVYVGIYWPDYLPTRAFHGALDEVAMFDLPLPAARLREHFRQGAGR